MMHFKKVIEEIQELRKVQLMMHKENQKERLMEESELWKAFIEKDDAVHRKLDRIETILLAISDLIIRENDK